MTRVKICGLSEIEHAVLASQSGADFLGLVFAPSRRQISPEKALALIEAVHSINVEKRLLAVGVFVNARAQEVNRIADCCRLDRVQLSGEESWDYCQKINRPVIKVIHVSAEAEADEVLADIEQGYRLFEEKELICLLDTRVGNAYGGTGQLFSWQVAEEVAARFPVIIAGGLTPDNVGQLVRQVHPWGVDVSTGVESKGKKDISKIKEFIDKVKEVGGGRE